MVMVLMMVMVMTMKMKYNLKGCNVKQENCGRHVLLDGGGGEIDQVVMVMMMMMVMVMMMVMTMMMVTPLCRSGDLCPVEAKLFNFLGVSTHLQY